MLQSGNERNKIEEFLSLNESLHRFVQSYLSKRINSTLSLPQIFLLHILRRNVSCTPSSIVQIMGVTSGAVTSLADRLYKQDLIKRERSKNDRRVVMLSLTDAGQKLAESLEQDFVENLAVIFNKLPEEDLDSLIRIFYKIQDVVKSL